MYQNYLLKSEPVGSTVTCNPPPQGTDKDYLYLVSDAEVAKQALAEKGFLIEGNGYCGDHFTSYRRGNTNLIVTSDENFYNKFLLATRVAKKFNLLRKEDRVTLFQAILYGNG